MGRVSGQERLRLLIFRIEPSRADKETIMLIMSLPVLRFPDFAHGPSYQLWTDALCLREMAKRAPNNYLQSMCVRNSVLCAWTTLEMACRDALGVPRFKGRDFKRNVGSGSV